MNKTPIIFLAFANNREDSNQYLRNLPKELDAIRTVLWPLEKAGICELIVRSNATLEQIIAVFQEAVYRDRIIIFHYGGHAGSYKLLLEDHEGIPHTIHSNGFNHFLSSSPGLRLVFLNACSTEAQADALIRAGLPLVIGTSQAIEDRVASDLATSFYQGLAEGISIGKAWEDTKYKLIASIGDRNVRSLYLRDRAEIRDQVPWKLHIRPGSQIVLEENLPSLANNPLFGLPPIPEVYYLKLPLQPYVNIRYFRKEDAAIFFGRGQEIRELYLRIKGIHSIILLYGQSGVGKSSLLEAGLLPRLEQKYEVYYVRRDPTLGLLDTFRRQINALSGRIEMPLAGQWLQIEQDAVKPLILILDQVEEAFTKKSSQEPYEELSALLDELAATFDVPQDKPRGKVILSYRKEYAPEIRKQIEKKALPYTDVFLERLSHSGIIEAITGIMNNPYTKDKYKIRIQNDAEVHLPAIIADDLLEDPSGAIAPVLQILLARMWEESEDKYFSRQLYQTLKKEGILLQDFFDRQMQELTDWKAEIVDSGLVLDLLQEHTTPFGTAATMHLQVLQQRYHHQSAILPSILQQCKDLYLLAQTSTDETSLSHDTLAPIVQNAYKKSDRPGQRALRLLESKSLDGQFEEAAILEENDLNIVELGKEGMRAWSKAEKQLVEDSWEAVSRRSRQKKQIRALAIIAALAILIFGAFATYFWKDSIRKSKEAAALYLISISKEKFSENPYLALRIAEAAYALDSINPSAPVAFQLTQVCHNARQRKWRFPKLNLRHRARVEGAYFSPDGQSVLTCSEDGTAKLWDLEGKMLADMKHGRRVSGAIFSSGGQRILTWSSDKTAKLWSLKGQVLADMKHKSYVNGALFSPDGQSIVTWSQEGTAKHWDLEGKLLADMKHKSMLYGATFSSNGRSILTYSADGSAKLWDLRGKLLSDMRHRDHVTGALFSPDGQSILTRSQAGTAKLWNLQGKMLAGMRHKEPVYGTLFWSDGQSILTYSSDGTAKLWNLEGKMLANMKHEDQVYGAFFSPDGQRILTHSRDGTAKLWDLQGNVLANMKHEHWVFGALFSSDGQSTLTWSRDGTARLWDLEGKMLADMKHADNIFGAFYRSDSQSILTWSRDGTARLWNLQGNLLAEMKHEDHLSEALFSPDGRSVLTHSVDGTAKLWDLHGNFPAEMKHEDHRSEALFSPDGQSILTHSRDSTAILWDLQGNVLAEMKHEGFVLGSNFSSNGKSILTHSRDSTAKLWDLHGNVLANMKHNSTVGRALFSPDGQSVLTRSADSTAKLWDLQGNMLANMKHNSWVFGAQFSPDGQSILIRSADSTAKLWDLQGHLLADIKHKSQVHEAIFSSNGHSILIYNRLSRTAELRNLQGHVLAEMKHEGAVSGSIFSEDSRSIITSSADGTAKLWDLQGNVLADMKHNSMVGGAQFSPDGQSILTWSADATARLWDLQGNVLTELKHGREVDGAIYSTDGQSILTWSRDKSAKLWNLQGNLLADMKHEGTVANALFSADGKSILTYTRSSFEAARLWLTAPAIFEWLKTAPIPELSEEEKALYSIPSKYRK